MIEQLTSNKITKARRTVINKGRPTLVKRPLWAV